LPAAESFSYAQARQGIQDQSVCNFAFQTMTTAQTGVRAQLITQFSACTKADSSRATASRSARTDGLALKSKLRSRLNRSVAETIVVWSQLDGQHGIQCIGDIRSPVWHCQCWGLMSQDCPAALSHSWKCGDLERLRDGFLAVRTAWKTACCRFSGGGFSEGGECPISDGILNANSAFASPTTKRLDMQVAAEAPMEVFLKCSQPDCRESFRSYCHGTSFAPD
jgi:hypothetical protein